MSRNQKWNLCIIRSSYSHSFIISNAFTASIELIGHHYCQCNGKFMLCKNSTKMQNLGKVADFLLRDQTFKRWKRRWCSYNFIKLAIISVESSHFRITWIELSDSTSICLYANSREIAVVRQVKHHKILGKLHSLVRFLYELRLNIDLL